MSCSPTFNSCGCFKAPMVKIIKLDYTVSIICFCIPMMHCSCNDDDEDKKNN